MVLGLGSLDFPDGSRMVSRSGSRLPSFFFTAHAVGNES